MAVETNIPLDPESFKIPAVFANRAQVIAAGGNVRISFSEAIGGVAGIAEVNSYRTAIVMTIGDAKDLAEAILKSTATAIAIPFPASAPAPAPKSAPTNT